jgi:hypothetical protein
MTTDTTTEDLMADLMRLADEYKAMTMPRVTALARAELESRLRAVVEAAQQQEGG